jgi:hypothetical protein
MMQSTIERSPIIDLINQQNQTIKEKDSSNMQNPSNPEQEKNILETNPFTSSPSTFQFAQIQSKSILELRKSLNYEISIETDFQNYRKEIFLPFLDDLSKLIQACNQAPAKCPYALKYPHLPKYNYNPEYKVLFDFIKNNIDKLKYINQDYRKSTRSQLVFEGFKTTFAKLDESELIISNMNSLQFGNPRLFSILNTIYKF